MFTGSVGLRFLSERSDRFDRCAWMPAGALRQDENAGGNKDRDDERGERPAEVQPALRDGLVEKIADRCAKWSRQDERRPEQKHMRDGAPEIESCHPSERRQKYERATTVSKARISRPVAKRRAERLGKSDGEPVEHFDTRCADRLNRNCSLRPIPDGETCQHTGEQQQ